MRRYAFSASLLSAVLMGCSTVQPNVSEAPLAEVIAKVRSDLAKASKEESSTNLPLTEVTLTLKLSSSSKDSSSADGKIGVVNVKFGADYTNSIDNTIVLKWAGKDDRSLLCAPSTGPTK